MAAVSPLPLADRPLLGIGLMIAFCALAPLSDSAAKALGDSVPLAQAVFARFVIQVAILAPFVWLGARSLPREARILGLMLLRTLLHIVGIGAMFLSLRFLPLADALAIAFVQPFLLILLAWLFMGERVGPRRLLACAAGFAGTLMVLQPSLASAGAAALLPLVVAVTFTLFIMVTRHLARVGDPITLQAVTGTMAVVILAPLVLLPAEGLSPELGLVWPGQRELLLLLALGGVGTFAHLLMTWALRFAPSATLAPIQYLEMPFAVLAGYLIFADFPGPLALTGIVVIMAAGVFIVLRERALAPARTAPTATGPAAEVPASAARRR